jgi:hypothetical protein
VEGCDFCRGEYDRLCAARDWVRKQAAGDGAAVPPMGLATLQGRLKELIAERTKADRRSAALQLKVAAEIAPFLGHRAAGRLLRSVRERSGSAVCCRAGSATSRDRAAAELVSHLIDTAIGVQGFLSRAIFELVSSGWCRTGPGLLM